MRALTSTYFISVVLNVSKIKTNLIFRLFYEGTGKTVDIEAD